MISSRRSVRVVPVLVLELELKELVITSFGRVLLAPVEVVVEPRGRGEDPVHQAALLIAVVVVQGLLEHREEVGLVLLRTPTSMPITCTGSRSANSRGEVELILPTSSSTIRRRARGSSARGHRRHGV